MPHATEVRAWVLADLALGLSVRRVAAKHHVGRNTVATWRNEALARGELPHVEPPTGQGSRRPPTSDGRDLGAWIADYVAAVFDAITTEARLLGDPEWLRQQSPEFVLRAHDDLSDRAARMVANAALSSPPGTDPPEGPGDAPALLEGVPAPGLDPGPAGGDVPNGVAS